MVYHTCLRGTNLGRFSWRRIIGRLLHEAWEDGRAEQSVDQS